MSNYGGGIGGRTRMGTKVYLNVYDLSPANDYLHPIGFGLHHSGVEILGTEYTFASGAGIFNHSPQDAPGAKFRERLELGIFEGTSADINSAIGDLRTKFGPDSYNLVTQSCNSFANALVWSLLRKTIPSYVNRLADVGSCCSCLLPQNLLEGAPVGDTNASGGSSGGSGFQVSGGNGRVTSFEPTKSQMSRPFFTGSGHTLGSTNKTSNRDGTKTKRGTEDLTDRREKARMAALARLERSGNSD
eukprot:747243_1